MDSHSRSASPREPSRPQHRPPSPPSTPPAFDNQAYQHDESDPNHNDSFTSNAPPQQNGHSKEPNGDTKTLEAVNLELINLTPKNGSTKQKKDVEVDMNASNPYDEYFVPVNEHRKYMRGEKLYVTADKRGEKGGCKRPLCWTLLGLVVAVIVALIVLAATGILFTNSPTPVEQYNGSISSARALGGLGNIHSPDQEHSPNKITHDPVHNDHDQAHGNEHHGQDQDKDHSEVADHDQTKTEIPVQHEPETQNDMEHDQSVLGSDEVSDASLYVPRTLEGELKIDNEEFSEALQDPESDQYREFVASFSNSLKRALFDRNTLEKGNNEITIEVVQLKKGSVIVTYRIHWKPKPNAKVTEDLLTEETLKTNLDNYLAKNNRMISIYHVAEDDMTTRRVLDLCLMNKKDCQYGCEFDETTLDFTCTCPQGQMLDMRNPQMCMSILENNEDHKEKELKILTINSNASTMRPIPEEEKPYTEATYYAEKENAFDWKETHHETPQTTTESDADLNFSHIFGHPSEKNNDHETETANPENSFEQHINTTPESRPQPTSEPEPAAETKPESEPTSESVFNVISKAEPTSEPAPAAEPKFEPELKSEPEPIGEPKPEPEPAVEPKPEPEPTSLPEPNTELKSQEVTVANSQEPQATPASEQKNEITFDNLHPIEPEISAEEPATESQPMSTIEVLPTSEPVPASMPESVSKPEPNSEPESVIESHMMSEPVVTFKPQFSTEPQTTFEPEPSQPTETQSIFNHLGEMGTSHESTQQNDNKYSSEMKTAVFINEGKYNIKTSDENDSQVETTTIRMSELQSSNINERDKKNEWLEDASLSQHNKEESNSDSENKNVTEMNTSTYVDLTNFNRDVENDHITEQRSFKTIDVDAFMPETTTVKAISKNTVDEDISFDLITKENEVPVTESTIKEPKKDTTTTESVKLTIDEKKIEENPISIPIKTTTMTNSAINETDNEMPSTTNSEYLKTDNNENKVDKTQSDKAIINTLIEEARLLNSNETERKEEMETTPTQPEITTEYSMTNQFQNTDEDKVLMGALNKKNETDKNGTSTEKDVTDEGSEITFDSINMLYNRSSKSINNQINKGATTTDSNDLLKETTSMSDSDWLSESVTEINYEEVMNKMEKHETTEPTITKIDEIMNRGLSKDDFEPDYLNNMGTTSGKMSESDEPLYGMVHDYDNEDSRVKRVNTESKETTTEAMIKNMSAKTMMTNVSLVTSLTYETTTVSDYIYKTANKTMNESISISQNHNETMSINTTTFENSEPAPVWEESDLTVKELPHKVENTQVTTIDTMTADEIALPSTSTTTTTTTTTSTTTTMAPTTVATSSESQDSSNSSINSENYIQNTTQVNNLNVTIYEISSHNGNQTFVTPKPTSTHSAEYVDHEPEMNPFLPETENNKSLVKKLQEGHDLEPTNLNETQNENVEEHSVNSSETEQSSKGTLNIPPKDDDTMATATMATATTEEDTLFNELLMNSHSQEEESNGSKDISKDMIASPTILEKTNENEKNTNNAEKPKEKEILPISTFLLDTDDLDNSKEHTTEHKTTVAENDLENETNNSPTTVPVKVTTDSKVMTGNDNLSVVPIAQEIQEKEAIKKNYNSENIQELNDISDSPKKSDRRTLDATKLDSVINNEA